MALKHENIVIIVTSSQREIFKAEILSVFSSENIINSNQYCQENPRPFKKQKSDYQIKLFVVIV